MSRISIIIPTYNAARYLPEALDSVLAQTVGDYEIIVIDDGSTDRTRDVLDRYREHIRSIRQDNRGQAAARNAGLQLAGGKYVAFLDADDLFLPNKLALQSTYLDQHPEIAVVYSDGLLFRVNDRNVEERVSFSQAGYIDRQLDRADRLERLLFSNGFPPVAALARRACIEEIGGFDPELPPLEDWDLWFRIAERHAFAYLSGLVAKYRVTPMSASQNLPRLSAAAERVKAKFARLPAFAALPLQVRARFYYEWGLWNLVEDRVPDAVDHLTAAIQLDRHHTPARVARRVITLLGKRSAALFRTAYYLKRRTLGRSGLIPVNEIHFEPVTG